MRNPFSSLALDCIGQFCRRRLPLPLSTESGTRREWRLTSPHVPLRRANALLSFFFSRLILQSERLCDSYRNNNPEHSSVVYNMVPEKSLFRPNFFYRMFPIDAHTILILPQQDSLLESSQLRRIRNPVILSNYFCFLVCDWEEFIGLFVSSSLLWNRSLCVD